MKRFFRTISTLLFVFTLLLVNTSTAFASGEDGAHLLEMDVDGYHVTLSSQNDWVKGENTVVVTLTDSMGMPLNNADVEILIAPKSSGHTETDGHEEQQNSMPGMDMGNSQPQDSMPGMDMGTSIEEMPEHQENVEPVSMIESDEHGMYTLETHLETSGEHDVHVMFHVNGEMLQADFVVVVPGFSSKTVILWGFVVVNIGFVTSAGVLKKQSILVKGGK
ncbi:MAG: hypothetical protein QM730_21340 [Anaerolineales bacterium]